MRRTLRSRSKGRRVRSPRAPAGLANTGGIAATPPGRLRRGDRRRNTGRLFGVNWRGRGKPSLGHLDAFEQAGDPGLRGAPLRPPLLGPDDAMAQPGGGALLYAFRV